MHRPRVYVDNSVISGTQDEEFAEESRLFFEQVREGIYRVLISDISYDEMEQAPVEAREMVTDLPDDALEEAEINDEVRSLADAYVSAGVLTRKREYDALHIAAATVARADLLLSWNFDHMVNYDRIRKFNAVNLLNGYGTLEIRSPREVVHGRED